MLPLFGITQKGDMLIFMSIRRCLEEVMGTRMKAFPDGERRVTLRASDVPLALVTKLRLAVARIDGSLRLLTPHRSFFLGG